MYEKFIYVDGKFYDRVSDTVDKIIESLLAEKTITESFSLTVSPTHHYEELELELGFAKENL